MKQKTIKNEISLEGIGVHSGKHAAITLCPAPSNHGISIIHALFPNESLKIGTFLPEPAMHATVLKHEKFYISTVEHLLAAISGLGIDNIEIVVEGTELPILDGSALPFVHALQNAQIIEQNEKKLFLTPKKILTFKDEEGRFIEITPVYDREACTPKEKNLVFDYSVEFGHPLVQASDLKGTLETDFFINEIAPARTFGFLEQLPFLRKHGLAQGTNLGNTVVVGNDSFLNSRRFPDEFIRHKLLDMIGDFALLGKNLAGTVRAHKTGHNFNRQVIEHYLNNPEFWELF